MPILSNVKKIVKNIDNTTTNPNGNTRLNFNNHVYATKFFGDGSALTGLPYGNITGVPTNLSQFTNNMNYVSSSVSNTFSAAQKFTSIKETKVDLGAGTVIYLDIGSYFTKTVTVSPTTFSITGAVVNGECRSFILEITNGGSYTLSFGFTPKWAGGVTPVLSAAGRDVLGFYCVDGATWNGILMSKDIK